MTELEELHAKIFNDFGVEVHLIDYNGNNITEQDQFKKRYKSPQGNTYDIYSMKDDQGRLMQHVLIRVNQEIHVI